jgi:2,3-bisphosphoglycerate-dependent phosphoglycerate mutase
VKDDRTRPLSQKGQKDAQRLLQLFKNIAIDYVYSSPYLRAMDTVKYLAEYHGKEVILCENFRERAIGTWVDDFLPYIRMQWDDFDYKLERGESLKEAQERNIMELNRLLQQHENATLVIGTHGTALSTIRNYYDDQFGLQQFLDIVDIMPYIVKMMFERNTLKVERNTLKVEENILKVEKNWPIAIEEMPLG